MARPRELLSLARIAEETGISYQTLRGYAIKHGREIPSVGSGRNTRYPQEAVKVFQRLRLDSKPGRKPRGAEAAPPPLSAPASSQPAVEWQGIERELAAIRAHLGSIAESLSTLARAAQSQTAPAVAAAAAPEPASTAPSPAVPEKSEIPMAARGLRDLEETGGQRRLHSLSKVRGQRGRRPD